jgi:hypothetical protein
MPGLSNFEKAVIQLLMTCKCVKKERLDELIESIKEDFLEDETDVSYDVLFAKLNRTLKTFSFEIKCVYMLDEGSASENSDNDDDNVELKSGKRKGDDCMTQFFALVNTESDQVAIDYGAKLSEFDIPTFKDILRILVEKNYESRDEIILLTKPKKWNEMQMHDFLNGLMIDGWLTTDRRGYLKIGARSHIELRQLLETVIADSLNSDNITEEEYTARLTQALNRLPQLLFY